MPTGWNKCPFVISKSQPKLFTDLVDSEGNATDVKLFLMIPATANYPNSTRPFTGEAAEFEPMRSVVFGDAKYGWNQMQGQLVASDGLASAVALRTILPFGMRSTDSAKPVNNNATASGVTFTSDAAEFEAARKNNRSLYIQISSSSSVANVTNRGVVAYDVIGLKPGHPYTFRFAAARDGSGAREGLYRAIGQNRVTASLEPMGNSTEVAKVADVLPDENGTIRLEMLSGPNNAHSARFVYLTAFSIEGDLSDAGGRRILWFGNSFSNGGGIQLDIAHGVRVEPPGATRARHPHRNDGHFPITSCRYEQLSAYKNLLYVQIRLAYLHML